MIRSAILLTRAFAALLLLVATVPLALADTAFDRGLLWRIDRDGQEPSYILGTIHVTDKRVLDVPKPVKSALAESNTAVFELVITPDLQAELARAMMFTDDQRLSDLMDEDLYAQTSDVAFEYGLIPSVLNMIKPWALIALFSTPPEETRRQSLGEPLLDGWLQDEARRQGKRLMALEEPGEQIAALDGLPIDDQIALVRATVENKAEVDRMFSDTLDFYLDRDLAGLEGLMDYNPEMGIELEQLDRFNQSLVVLRNDRMTERLMPMLEDGGVFVAIGALHLPGDNGLLQQLTDAGYTVTAVY